MRNQILALCAATLLGFASSANATVITIADCYTGDCGNLTGSITVTITDDTLNENPGTDDVKVVIANGTNGFIDQLGLFYTGGLSGAPAIQLFSGSGGTGTPSLGLGSCATDNSSQGLNVCFDFPQPNAARFDAGDTVTFYIDSLTAALLASNFADGAFAHINEVDGGGGSAKIIGDNPPQAPEPATLVLLGVGAVSATLARRRRRARA